MGEIGEADDLAQVVLGGLDDRRGLAQSFELVAEIASGRGLGETAGRLLGAASVIRRALAVPGTTSETKASTPGREPVSKGARNVSKGRPKEEMGEDSATKAAASSIPKP